MPSKRQEKVRRELPSHLYGVRVGPILGFPHAIAEMGVDPAHVLALAELDQKTFDDPNNRISIDALGRLCKASEMATGCPHIVMLACMRFDFANLGELGQLMKHSPTVGHACRNMALHLHLHDRVAVPLLFASQPGRMALGYSVMNYETVASDKIQDGTLAILFCLMRALCGQSWKPILVQFAHSKPQDVAIFRKFFDVPLQFDAQFSALVFAAKWLDQPIEGADPALHQMLTDRLLQSGQELEVGLAEKVRRALRSMVLSGTASIEAVAMLFECSERTLRRRLETQGTSFQELLNETLLSLAKQLLTETTLSVSDITAALHYRNVSTFSDAFRRWTGASPTQWRSDNISRKTEPVTGSS